MFVYESVCTYMPCVWRSETASIIKLYLLFYLNREFISVQDSCPRSFQEICCISFLSPCKSVRITEESSQGILILILDVYPGILFPTETSLYSSSYVFTIFIYFLHPNCKTPNSSLTPLSSPKTTFAFKENGHFHCRGKNDTGVQNKLSLCCVLIN